MAAENGDIYVGGRACTLNTEGSKRRHQEKEVEVYETMESLLRVALGIACYTTLFGMDVAISSAFKAIVDGAR